MRVIKRSSYGYYLVKICVNYNNNNIKLCIGQEYVVDCVLLKKVNIKTWQALVSQKLNENKIEKSKKKSKQRQKKKNKKK